MGLKDRSPPRVRRIAASMMALALVVQVLFGLIQSSPAYAATAVTISPDAPLNWQAVSNGAPGSSVHFVNTLGAMGTGSAQFNLPAASQSQSLSAPNYGTVKLADISALGYETYTHDATSVAPSLEVTIDIDTTDADTSPQGTLVYSPAQNGLVTEGQWQHHNARDGVWWFSDSEASDLTCSQAIPCTLNAVITLYPNAGIASDGGVGFTATTTDTPSLSNVDGFVFNEDVYNFEAIAAPQLTNPVNDGTSGATLVSSWQAVPTASKYIYESYSDDAATQLRASEMLVETQRTEADIVNATTVWWRVKAVDAQGNEGSWSELRKVTIAVEEAVPASGIISGSGSGESEELLAQLVRLNEPFAVPYSLDTFDAPHVYTVIDGTIDRTSDIVSSDVLASPVADQGVRTAAAVPTESGWKFFGVLWYWWALPVGALIAVAMRTIRLVRNSRTFLYSSDQI